MNLVVDIYKKLPGFTLDVAFATGDNILGILGASGSGKSMTLRCIAGLEKPDRGRIVLNGKILFDAEHGINLPSQERNIGFLFQNYALFPHMTVYQNIAFGLCKKPKQEVEAIVKNNLQMVELEGFADRYPSQLSGGQQQRVALARALAKEPDALLLDEPFSALDSFLRSQMEKEIIRALSGYNGTTLFVTHNLDEAYRVCRNLMVMDKGRKIADDDKEEIFKYPPTYAAAQITGCKNFSRAVKVSEHLIEAVDWGCHLKIAQPMPRDFTHVGIRAHHLVFTDRADGENTFPCWLSETSEGPHRMTLYIHLNGPSQNEKTYHLHAEVYKDRWGELVGGNKISHIWLNPERLFLTKDV